MSRVMFAIAQALRSAETAAYAAEVRRLRAERGAR